MTHLFHLPAHPGYRDQKFIKYSWKQVTVNLASQKAYSNNVHDLYSVIYTVKPVSFWLYMDGSCGSLHEPSAIIGAVTFFLLLGCNESVHT